MVVILIQNFQYYRFKKTLFFIRFEPNLFLLEHLFEGICNWPQYLPDHKDVLLQKLEYSFNNDYVEFIIRYIKHFESQFQSEWSEDLLKLIKKPVPNIYACSLLCMVIGILQIQNIEKLLWDYFHEFKNLFPNKKYHQGPLIGLFELKNM